VESNWVHSALRPPIGLLCQLQVIMMMEKLVEWLAVEAEVLGENLPQMPLCPPQNPHDARTRTRAASVGSQRLTAWTTARPLHVGLPSSRLPSGFPMKILNAFPCYMPCLPHSALLYHCNYIFRRVHVIKLHTMQYSPTISYFTSLRSKNVLKTLSSDTLSRCSSLSATGRILHPHKTTAKILDLCI
jgi:hypothetical protein